MHLPINVKSPNNISKWQIGFNSAFKGLMFVIVMIMIMIMIMRKTATTKTMMMTTSLILQFRSVLYYKYEANNGHNAKYRDGIQTRNKINIQGPKKIKTKNNKNILHQV
jgi:archaellum biogenesis protein FlaJ (TadC family)